QKRTASATTADVGLSRKEIHEARQIRDASVRSVPGQSRRYWHVRHMSVLRGISDMAYPFAPVGPRSDPGPHFLAGTIPGFVLKFPESVAMGDAFASERDLF